jgi:2-polyprenyl-3-methyl-5-hydroxy-6-metoxy-1,4-benzoquinol methylase
MKSKILSPLTNSDKVNLVGSISSKFLIDKYKEKLNVDIKRLIDDKEIVNIYKCKISGLYFFKGNFEFGDSQFYQDLEKIDWYYPNWKWDYETAFDQIKYNDRVLDIGCGFGFFLEKIKNEKNCDVEGIEFNKSAIQKLNEKNIQVHEMFIEDFVSEEFELFDVVCSFQVLEHVENPYSFIKSKIKCVKKGGKIIIAVPNNDSFIKYSHDNVLNMPPHHTLLWNKKSLTYISKLFSLKIIGIYYEKVDRDHSWYKEVIDDLLKKSEIHILIEKIVPFYKRIRKKIIEQRLNKGHSMIIVFEKK